VHVVRTGRTARPATVRVLAPRSTRLPNKARPLRCGDATRCCHKHSTRSCACLHVRKHSTRVCMCSFRTYRGPKGQGKAHKEPHHRENDVACKNLVDDLPKVPFSISPGLTLSCTRAWCSPRERASVRERRRTLTDSVFFERSMPASKNASPGHMPSTRAVDTLREGVAHHGVRTGFVRHATYFFTYGQAQKRCVAPA
jgi:hypothetical protein